MIGPTPYSPPKTEPDPANEIHRHEALQLTNARTLLNQYRRGNLKRVRFRLIVFALSVIFGISASYMDLHNTFTVLPVLLGALYPVAASFWFVFAVQPKQQIEIDEILASVNFMPFDRNEFSI